VTVSGLGKGYLATLLTICIPFTFLTHAVTDIRQIAAGTVMILSNAWKNPTVKRNCLTISTELASAKDIT